MLETQFLLINTHFTVNLFAALVSFAVSWLYFDAWLGRKDLRESSKSFGFFMLSVSFVMSATALDQSIIQDSIFAGQSLQVAIIAIRAVGYITLIIGQIVDPLQPMPSYRLQTASAGILGISFASIGFSEYIQYMLPILASITGFLYIRRATVGLEFHLRTIGYSFFTLSIAEVMNLAKQFRNTDNIDLENFVAAFKPLWIIQLLLTFIALFILGKWVWSYLIKRLETQLFMIFTTTTLTIFMITAVFFTSVSLINLRSDIMKSLEVSASVLEFTIDSKEAETLSDAQVIAQNSQVIQALIDDDKSALREIATETLLVKNQAFLTIVKNTGEIVVRADDPEKIGGSLSDDPIVKKALEGVNATGLSTTDGVIAPTVSVRASVPILDGNDQIGAVLVGTTIDNAFVDGLKEATGLDASIYGDNVRSATTFIAPDGKSRYIGIKEDNEGIKKSVLIDGDKYVGDVDILNVPYIAAFQPLKDTNGSSIGMLFVGRPQIEIIRAASNLIEQTFVVTAILLAISIIPAYMISNYIIKQVNA